MGTLIDFISFVQKGFIIDAPVLTKLRPTDKTLQKMKRSLTRAIADVSEKERYEGAMPALASCFQADFFTPPKKDGRRRLIAGEIGSIWTNRGAEAILRKLRV